MTPRKVSFGTQLPEELLAQVRAAVVDLQRSDPAMTIARFTEFAFTKALEDLPSIPPAVGPAPRQARRGKRIRGDGSS